MMEMLVPRIRAMAGMAVSGRGVHRTTIENRVGGHQLRHIMRSIRFRMEDQSRQTLHRLPGG